MRPFLWIALLAEASMKTGIRLLLPVLLLCSLGLGQANSPVPQIANPLVPSAVVPGGPAFTLTVNGTGFVSGSTVYWNGIARTTVYVSAAQITASIGAGDVATAASGLVTVHNPGGTISNTALLLVTNPVSVFAFGAAGIPQTVNPSFWDLVVGDLNQDAIPDILVSEGINLDVALGNGDGSLQVPVYYPLPGSSRESYVGVLADFNNDGKLDFVVSSVTTGTLDVFLGNGDGTFQPVLQQFSGFSYIVAAAGDFNGDGNLDLVYTAYQSVGVLLGNGDGTFGPPTTFPVLSSQVNSVAVGDFNRDGILDIAAGNAASGGGNGSVVSILQGLGDGTFASHVDYAVGRYPVDMSIGDLNGDSYPDIAVVDAGNYNTFFVLLNNGDGTFQSPVQYGGPYSSAQFQTNVLGDFNGDGKLDFAVYDTFACNDGCVYIFAGNGDGTLQPAMVFAHRQDAGGFARGEFAVADFNRDGKLDIVSPGLWPFVMIQTAVPQPTIESGSMSFAPEPVGMQSPAKLEQLLQPGNTAITINTITPSGDFQTDGGCVGHVLNPGNTRCPFNVFFTPSQTGLRTGSLTINSSGGTQYVTLTGTGTLAINISISPSVLSFATQELNSTSLNLNVTLTNTGSQTLNLNSITLSGANRGDFLVTNLCGSTLAVGASCTVEVAFRPSATGLRTASLNIADNAANSPQTVPLSGTGTALHISTNLLQFGNVTVGSSSSRVLTLRNLGFRTISVGQIKIIGGNGNNYSQTNTCGSGIPPRSNCTLTVTFTPQRQGQLNAALSFSTNGSGTQAVSTVSLRGRGE